MGRSYYYPSTAGFIVDPGSLVRDYGRQIDWANVPGTYRETPDFIVKLSAAAAADAVALAVDALPYAVPAGTNLYFGQAKELAHVTTAAAAGATALVVEALPSALEDDDEATVFGSGSKTLPAGTRVGELLGNGKISPRIVSTNPAFGILETDAIEDDPKAPLSGYGVLRGGHLYENLLPGATGSPAVIASGEKTELAANSAGFLFSQYQNTAGD